MASPPQKGQRFIYQLCENVKESNGEIQFETKSWCPVDLALQNIQNDLLENSNFNDSEQPWMQHYQEGLKELCNHIQDLDTDGLGFIDEGWRRPDAVSDKLYMSMGGGDVIEVGHPTPRDGQFDPR